MLEVTAVAGLSSQREYDCPDNGAMLKVLVAVLEQSCDGEWAQAFVDCTATCQGEVLPHSRTPGHPEG